MAIMNALVLEVRPRSLLVRDRATSQEVLVLTPWARLFRPGMQVRILFNGVMTKSIPPQINAIRIIRIGPFRR